MDGKAKKILSFIVNINESINNKFKHTKKYTGEGVFIHKEAELLNLQNNKNSIHIGNDTHIRGQLVVFPSGGCIVIGKECYLGENSKIWSQCKICIGNNVLIAHNVNIFDTNTHPLGAEERRNDYRQIIHKGFSDKNENIDVQPISIEDDVWIGCSVIILKGVHIGKRSIIAAGSVVTRDVGNDVMVAGNPAVVVKSLKK